MNLVQKNRKNNTYGHRVLLQLKSFNILYLPKYFSIYKMYNVHITTALNSFHAFMQFYKHIFYIYIVCITESADHCVALNFASAIDQICIWFFEIQHKSVCTSGGNIKNFYKIFNFRISNTQDEYDEFDNERTKRIEFRNS